jgi:TRAP-type mannitol/chloroaromatic compound transport system substrate-binding protein
MKKALSIVITLIMAVVFICGTAHAKREKFGEDPRAKEAKRVSFKTSDENIRWKMVMPWSKGLLFYDIASHFADSVRLASAGRLDIKVFAADELVPAMQSLDAEPGCGKHRRG